jgi:hypothetical protein
MLRQLLVKSLNTAHLPPRPGVTVLSDSIPLFYIGRNHEGFWVVREAEGRIGGLFLLRCSALRFARQKSLPAGCATMFVTEPLELDLPNQGGRVAELIARAMNVSVVGELHCNGRRRMAQACKPDFAPNCRSTPKPHCHRERAGPPRVYPDFEKRRRSAGSAMIAARGGFTPQKNQGEQT